MSSRSFPLLLVVACAPCGAGEVQFLGKASGSRQLQESASECALRAARLLPTPSLSDFDTCISEKISPQSGHDWGLPGAEFAALADCWCEQDLTSTMTEYSCCSHASFTRACSLDCTPDCKSSLAEQCINECPSMCLEAVEYQVGQNVCASCDADKCWPVIKCLTGHAKNLTEDGELGRTCHETDFYHANQLDEYWKCWQNAPKHSNHWNTVSSILHCACREGMDKLANDTDCCDSLSYGGGVCEVTCPSEETCSSQAAQTCIHLCQTICSAAEPSPSQECKSRCLDIDASCRSYLACRPPMITANSYVCDDGKWPESSSGCCYDDTNVPACPRLCETQLQYRLDRNQNYPWWSRWDDTGKGVYQCTCLGCPSTTDEVATTISNLNDNIWDNGQVMLVDIARREGLKYGPNRRMQELMAERNEAVLYIIAPLNATNRAGIEKKVVEINSHYTALITEAAQKYEDDGWRRGQNDRDPDRDRSWSSAFAVLVVSCTLIILIGMGLATYCVIQRRKSQSPITAFEPNDDVVIGRAVASADSSTAGKDAITGAPRMPAPVTVSAPTKSPKSEVTMLS